MRVLSICAIVVSMTFMFAVTFGAFSDWGGEHERPYAVVDGRK